MSGERLLVIEDDLDVQSMMRSILTAMGYEVSCASDGNLALRKLRTEPHPAVILLDLMMPRMDGYRFREAQLADPALASIPTLVITAEPRVSPYVLGDVRTIKKPFDPDELLRTIATLCVPRVTPPPSKG